MIIDETYQTTYTIPTEAFLGPIEDISEDTDIESPVTRENFTAQMLESFAKSRGVIPAQVSILEWKMANDGFDYQETLTNYIAAGGYNALSTKEQYLIITFFRRVAKHAEKLDKPGEPFSDKQVLEGFDYYLQTFPTHFDNGGSQALPRNVLKGMSKTEFLDNLNKSINSTRRRYMDQQVER